MSAKPPEYIKLKRAIEKQIKSIPDGLREFSACCHDLGHVGAFKLDKKDAIDVIARLERKLIIGPDNFDQFVNILKLIERDDVIRLIPGYEKYGLGDKVINNGDNSPGPLPLPGTSDRAPAIVTRGSGNHQAESNGITDLEIQKLCDFIRPKDELRVGVFLGIPVPQIEKYLQTNRVFRMLVDWRNGVPDNEQRGLFIKAVTDAELGDLVTQCLGEEAERTDKSDGSLSRNSIVSDKYLAKLAGKIGKGWNLFGIEHLGMEQHNIDHIEADSKHVANMIFKMLYKYREKEKATIGQLLDKLEASEHVSEDSYRFIVDEFAIR